MRPLIITRPRPMADTSLIRAHALGLNAHAVPLFLARALPWQAPDPARYDALFLSSAQSLKLGGAELNKLKSLPVYAVGAATAEAASDAGFHVVKAGNSDGQTLIAEMEESGTRSILWLCGRDRSSLAGRNARLDPLACYGMDAIAPPPVWAEMIAGSAVITAYSTRAAQRIADLVKGPRSHISLIAISKKVADALGAGWKEILIAEHPDDAAMLAAACILCHKSA